jgi:trimethylamine--corrinoid protein Co-methyltransferase
MSLAHACHAIWRHCGKPLYFSPDHDRVMRVIVEMARVVAGANDLRARPLAICQVSPTSPLQWEQGAADSLILAARAGFPVAVLPEPFCGVSAPVSLAGTLVMHHAETLSGVVLANAARTGAPIIYGSAWTTFDMRVGNVSIGAPETMLLRIAGGQLARHCRLPYHCIGPDTDSQLIDYQSATEKTSTAWAALCGGVNVFVNCGMIATGMTVGMDQLVLDDELAGYMKRIAAGIRVDRETLASDAIREVGPAGNFLTHDLTLALMRSPSIGFRRSRSARCSRAGSDRARPRWWTWRGRGARNYSIAIPRPSSTVSRMKRWRGSCQLSVLLRGPGCAHH